MDGTHADGDPSVEKQATKFLADSRFHRTLWIAPDKCRHQAARGSPPSRPLRVAYSDLGDPDGTPLLVVGGLFGTRYTLALADRLARERGVRLITPDKPGIGGTSAVEVEMKVWAWLDITEALVEQLSLGPVTFLGHSSGAIYVLNIVLHLRHLLHPQRPYVALVAPWVHPSHSHAVQATIASALPDWAIQRFYDTTNLLTRTGVSARLGPSTARPGVDMKDTDPLTKAIDEKVLRYALDENIEGVSQEALFCLKRGSKQIWGDWEDYDGFLRLLRKSEATNRQIESGKLMVDVYFAEADNTAGEHGSEWFDECWKNEATDSWMYRSCTAPGSTHETIMRPEVGVLEDVFQTLTSE